MNIETPIPTANANFNSKLIYSPKNSPQGERKTKRGYEKLTINLNITLAYPYRFVK